MFKSKKKTRESKILYQLPGETFPEDLPGGFFWFFDQSGGFSRRIFLIFWFADTGRILQDSSLTISIIHNRNRTSHKFSSPVNE